MTDYNPKPGRTYADQQFLDCIPDGEGEYIASYNIAFAIGCTWETVNRRVAAIADDEGIEIYDPEIPGLADPDDIVDSSRPVIAYGYNLSPVLDDEQTRPDPGFG